MNKNGWVITYNGKFLTKMMSPEAFCWSETYDDWCCQLIMFKTDILAVKGLDMAIRAGNNWPTCRIKYIENVNTIGPYIESEE